MRTERRKIMKIDECEINMKVRAKKDISRRIKKGDEVEIRYVEEIQNFIEVDNGEVIVTEIDPKYFEPISKFEIGDKVIYDSPVGMKKVDIFGYIYCEKDNTWLYAIKLPTNKHVIVREDTLQKEKNIFDLKKGDKFKCKTATGITTGITKRIYKVLAAAKCKRINRVKYFAEEIKGDSIGYVGIFIADDINKIIY